MKFFLKFLIMFFLVSGCVSCSQKPAKIVDRSKTRYGRDNPLNKSKYREAAPTAVPATLKQELKPTKTHIIEVENGDTLFGISKKYQVTVRDLVKANKLEAPYNLKTGSKMTIPAPNYHEVKPGETLYAISRSYNMKIDSLIELNDLKEPYSVRAGEKLRISQIGEAVAEKTPQKEFHLAKPEEKKSESFVEKTLDKFNHFSWPVKGPLVSRFGPKSGGLYNDGVNIKAREGTEVKSSEDGVVAYVGNELKGYGNLVIVKHSGGWITAYAHLQNAVAKRGQKVHKGQKIGTVGSTGNVTSPQLYFGLRKGRDAVNPENYLKS